jgi:hypothetical protein
MARSAAHAARNKSYREGLTDNVAAQAASMPTAQRIPLQAKELGVEWEAEDVPSGQGGRIHWVGDRAAKKVILYFHGVFPFVPTGSGLCSVHKCLIIIRWRLWAPYISWKCEILYPESTGAGRTR